MRKVSDIRGKDAIDLLADLIDPVIDIMSDKMLAEVYSKGRNADVAKYIMKNYSDQILLIMALIEGEDPNEYQPSPADIVINIMQILNDPVFSQFFTSQAQSMVEASSGSVMQSTEAIEQN